MKAAWYERQGAPFSVLVVGEMPTPDPVPGEVRIRVAASGVNPGDVKKRHDTFGVGMPFPRVVPHGDGAGVIEVVGEGIPASRVGERVWCFGAQNYRPFGTAAECVVVPAEQAIPLSDRVSFEQGALNEALAGEWPGFEVEGRFPLESIAEAHEAVEERKVSGRVILSPRGEVSAA